MLRWIQRILQQKLFRKKHELMKMQWQKIMLEEKLRKVQENETAYK